MTAMLAVAAFPVLSLLLIGLTWAERSLFDGIPTRPAAGPIEPTAAPTPGSKLGPTLAPARSGCPRHRM